ncbi:TraM recognition domain-containing protein [bacterium]|nr:TraM recognition domain-containing protein [bacterium]
MANIHLGYRLPGGTHPGRTIPRPSVEAGDSSLGTKPPVDELADSEAEKRRKATITVDPRMRFQPGSVEPVFYDGTLHGITVAPTGAGKGRCLIIPNLLRNPTTTVVIDPKGENAIVTANRREAMGHEVHIIAPFGIRQLPDIRLSAINPFDCLKQPGADLENDAAQIAHMICENSGKGRGGRGGSSSNDPFWDNNGRALLTAIILAVVTTRPASDHHIGTVYEMLHSDDVVYNLAVLLDTCGGGRKPPRRGDKKSAAAPPPPPPGDGSGKPSMNRAAYQEIAAFLQMPEVTRGGVLATAQSYLKLFSSEGVQESLRETSFNILDFIAGKRMTIYLVLPVDKLSSHSPLLKLWLTTLLKCAFAREEMPETPTLFLIDEAAQLGHLDDIEKAMTVGRGFGLQLWTFWQDLAQLRQLYPDSWYSMFNNCGFVNMFGARNHFMKAEMAEVMNVTPSTIDRLAPDEQLLMLEGTVEQCWIPDYLRDAGYVGLADDNLFYPREKSTKAVKPPPPTRNQPDAERAPKSRLRQPTRPEESKPSAPPESTAAEPDKEDPKTAAAKATREQSTLKPDQQTS